MSRKPTRDRVCKPRWVCVMSVQQASRFENADLTYKCFGGRHTHYSREAVVKLVASGTLAWVGKGHKVAKYLKGTRTWKKTMSRDGYSSVAVMQLVPGA